MEAKKYYRDFEPRGKADDITVIVAQVHSRNPPNLKNGPSSYELYYEQALQGTGPAGATYSEPYYIRIR